MEWKASHILVKDQALAQDLSRRIKQGANFEGLAREFTLAKDMREKLT